MANPYSILHNYDQAPVYTPDFNFIQTGLSYKQGKYDQNKQKLISALDEYKMLDVYRDVDKEYVEERLNAVLKVADQYGRGDLSYDNYTNSIGQHLSQILDPTVKNAVRSTKLFKVEQSQWEQLREKSPEKYSQLNHEYALRSSEKWRSGEVAGEQYRGGGGPIEYVDVNKTFMEAIPKMQDMLKAEWIQDGPGNGYFRSISTYEAVPRQMMEQALNTLLGEREKNQLRINAWGQYSKVDSEILKDDYDSYFSPQLEAATSNLEKYNKMIDIEKDDVKRQQLIQLRDTEERVVNDLTSNSFDNVVNTYGTEAAYSTLYMSKFKDQYLNAYSYAPREIKREVNQLDVETRNLELKIRSQDFDQQMREKQFALNVSNSEFEREKFAIQQGLKEGDAQPIIGSSSPLGPDQGYNEDMPSHVEAEQKLVNSSISGMKDLLRNKFGNLSNNQILQLSGQLKNIAGKNSINITIDGETQKIDLTDDDNLQAILDFKDYALNDSPNKKFEQDGVNKILRQVKEDLVKVATSGNSRDIDLSKLPNYGIKFVPGDRDSEGNIVSYKTVKNDYSGGSYYGYLLRKTNRTDAENLTLDYYTSLHTISDPVLSKEQRQSVFNAIESKIYSKVDGQSVKQLPKNWFSAYGVTKGHGELKRSLINIIDSPNDQRMDLLGAAESNLDKYGLGDDYRKILELKNSLKNATGNSANDIKKELNKIKSRINSETQIVPNNIMVTTPFGEKVSDEGRPDFYLSDMTAGDLEWNGGGIGRGFDTYIKSSFQNLYNGLEQRYSDQNMSMDLKSQIFYPEMGAKYDKLAYSLGLPKGTKTPITLTRKLDDKGNPTGQVDFTYTGGTTAKPVVITSKDGDARPLSAEQAASFGIEYAGSDRPRYRASYGENAPKIELGSSKVDRDVEVNTRKVFPDLPLDNASNYIDEAAQYGAQKPIADALSGFYSGAYEFKLEPIDGVWQGVITRNGKQVYSETTNQADYTTSEVKDLYRNSYYFNQTLFNNYLADLKDEAIRNAKIESARR